MKNKTVKSILQKKNVARAAALITAAAVFATSVNSYSIRAEEQIETEEEDLLTKVLDQATGSVSKDNTEISKEETVYVISDATGNVTETIVSDWLKNPEGADTLSDSTDLSDIENVKGDEVFQKKDGDVITWEANGSDIYYQGKSTKETPIDVKISYFLDDKEVSPEEIAGKSGKVKIRFDYTNKQKEEITVDGKTETIYVPFAVVSGMILPVDNFTNVTVSNGKVISEGNNNIVVGLAFPGLEDSIGLDENSEIEIPDYVEVTANAENFELSMTVSLAMSDILDTVDISGDLDFSEIGDKMNELTDATDQLLDGSGQLADGTKTLKDGTKTLADGANTLDSKKSELTDGANRLATGINEYTNGVGKLAGGINTLKKGTAKLKKNMPALSSGVKQLKDGSATAKNGSAQLVAGYEGANGKTGAVEGAKQVAAGAKQLNESVAGISLPSASLTDTDTAAIKAAAAQQIQSREAEIKQQGAAGVAQNPEVAAGANQIGDGVSAGMLTLANQSAAGGAAQAAGVATNAAVDVAVKQNIQAIAASAGLSLSDDQVAALASAAEQTIAGAINQNTEAIGAGVAASAQVTGAAENAKNTVSAGVSTLAQQVGGSVAYQTAQSVAGDAAVSGAQGVAAQVNATLGGFGEKLEQLKAGTKQLADGSQTVATGVEQLYQGTKQLDAGLGTLDNGLGTLQGNSKKLVEGVTSLNDGAESLKTGAGQLTNNSAALVNGGAGLLTGTNQVADAIGKLAAGATTLDNGAGTLKDGAVKLSDGMIQFNEEGIKKITNALEGSGDVTNTFDRLKAVKDSGKNYQSFTGLADGAKGSVKFIIKTGEVKAD